MEILSFGIQAPGLDQGVGEMFRFVGPTAGNRALFLRITLPPSQICKEFPWACNTAWGSGPQGSGGCPLILTLVPHYVPSANYTLCRQILCLSMLFYIYVDDMWRLHDSMLRYIVSISVLRYDMLQLANQNYTVQVRIQPMETIVSSSRFWFIFVYHNFKQITPTSVGVPSTLPNPRNCCIHQNHANPELS